MTTKAEKMSDDRPTDLAPTPSQDLATILSQLPSSGAEDDVTRVIGIYEAGERNYRAAFLANSRNVSSSASSNR